mmetsp:Transcript_32908/g.90787  ORF Transcript_32908/g.90787 Transcript_32908/m.90787 type:complete len:673 (+) Transcript_32908:104-2122(+)
MQAAEPADAEDYTESDDEGADGYRKGGYHAVSVGEVYNGRYSVIAKLGWGHFSTVWLCQDIRYQRYVAMKVQKSAPHYTEAAYDEIELLAQAAKRGNTPEWEATQQGQYNDVFPTSHFTGVVQLIDYFEHVGPNGKHVCMVFETMGPNVLALIKRYQFKGVPMHIVRKVATHILIGLDYLHRICSIIHTDLKPENVLVACPKGIPVNKHGMPLVGNLDPALLDGKQQPVMSEMLFQVKDAVKQAKADKKKVRKSKKAEKDGVEVDATEGGADDCEDDREVVPGTIVGKVAGGSEHAEVTQAVDPTAMASLQSAWQVGAMPFAAPQKPPKAPGERGIIEPPYMKPMLKPTRSDPTLLSSYGDDSSMLMKPPYHHFQALCVPGGAQPGTDPTAAGAAGGPTTNVPGGGYLGGPRGAVPGAQAHDRQKQTQQPQEKSIEKLLVEVANLDLFDHPDVMFKVADLGNACWVEKHFSDDIQTRQYRSPETIINANYDTSADMWSLACMLFELVTGDYLFDPKASEEYPRDEDHLALFTELLGPMPKPLIARGRRSPTYFNRRGEFRHIKSLRYWGLADVLQQKYHMYPIEAKNLASFLGPMLRLSPEERSTAQQLMSHPWLRGLPSPEVTEAVARMSLHPPLGVADGEEHASQQRGGVRGNAGPDVTQDADGGERVGR